MLDHAPTKDHSLAQEPRELQHDVLVRDGLAFLRASWLTISAWMLVCLMIGTAYVALSPKIYTAEATIVVDTRLPTQLMGGNFESLLTLDTPQLESQIVLLKSRRILDIVAKHHKVQDDPTLTEGVSSSIFTLLGKQLQPKQEVPLTPEEQLGLARWHLSEGLEVKRIGVSHAISITYSSLSPEKAATYANAFADAYIEDQIETRNALVQQATNWLEGRIEDLRNRMNAAARQVQEFRARRDYRIPGRSAAQAQTQAGARLPVADARESTLEELETRAQAFRTIYESYLTAYARSDQRQSQPAVTARVINRAEIGSKTHPRTVRSILLALVLGCVIGIGFAFLRRALRQPVM